MKKCKFLRKAYLMTCYHLECNSNLEHDYPAGRTNKKPSTQQDIIEASFSTMLNLDKKTGAKLFAEYSIKHIDLRTNAVWLSLLQNKSLFNVDGLSIEIMGSRVPIFAY